MAGETRLLLVDATNLVHQAYHAWPPRRSRDGQPVNAVEGFVQLLLRLLDQHRPHALALAFDPGGSTFRHELFADYKAQRDPPDEDLTAQWPLLDELAEAFRWPAVRVPGYEADDVLATLTTMAVEAGWTVELASADRDLCQLVNESVTLHAARGRGEVDVYDPEAVRERYGLAPELLPDWKGLVGDRSDNYPGVTGIGEKTATELLQTYLDLDRVLEAGKLLPGKRGQRLRSEADKARLGRQLATLCRTVPVDITLAELRRREPDQAAVASLLERLDLQALRRRLNPRLLTAPKSLSYQRVTDHRLAESVADEVSAAQAVGLAWIERAGLGLATDLGRAWVCPPDWLDQVLAPVSDGRAVAVTADYGALAAGLGAGHPALAQVRGDPRVAGWLLEPRGPDFPSPWSPARLLNDPPPDRPPAGWGAVAAWTAARDADYARRLEPRLREGLDEAGLTQRYVQVELELARLWARLSEVEVPLDDEAGHVDARWWREWLTDGGRRIRLRPCLDESGRLLRRNPDLAQLTAGRAGTMAWRARIAAPAGCSLLVARWPGDAATVIAELSGERAPLPDDRDLLADVMDAAADLARDDEPQLAWLASAPVVHRWLRDLLAGLAHRGRVRTAGGRPLRWRGWPSAPPSERAAMAAQAVRWQVTGTLLEQRQAACLAAAAAGEPLATLLPPLGAGLWWLVPQGDEAALRSRLAAAGLASGWSGERWSLLVSWPASAEAS